MRTYILRRLLQIFPLLLGITAITFLLLQLAPGDFLNTMAENPAISTETLDAMRSRFGLDRPWYLQYALYLKNLLLRFDFGESFSRHQPVFVVNGESDRMVPSKNTVDLDRRLPNSQLVVYPDAGHGGVFQFHEDFVKRALKFL